MGYNGELGLPLARFFFILIFCPGLFAGYLVGKFFKIPVFYARIYMLIAVILLIILLSLGIGYNTGGSFRLTDFMIPFLSGIPFGVYFTSKANKYKSKNTHVRK